MADNTKSIKTRIAAAWYQQTGTRLRGRITIKGDGCIVHTKYGAVYGLRRVVGKEWNFPVYMYCLL